MDDHAYDICVAALDLEHGTVRGTITNLSRDIWERGAGVGELKLGVRVLAGSDGGGVQEARGAPLADRLAPGEPVAFEAEIDLGALSAGHYIVEIGLLREHLYWFHVHDVPTWRAPLLIVRQLPGALPQLFRPAPPHPYPGLPEWRFWKAGVVGQPPGRLGPTPPPPFAVAPEDRVATAGSCFAQHIARRLRSSFRFVQPELPPPGQESYFAANYGNIYTARQLHQLLLRAYGLMRPRDITWRRADGRYIDPFRPQFMRDGFASEAAVCAARATHLLRVREVFEQSDVFVFTLGLTEAWVNTQDGAVLPVPPGVVAIEAGAGPYDFVNFRADEVGADLTAFIADARRVNPALRIILTISPVPIVATYEDRHVLVSHGYSKAALRVAADAAAADHADVAYFPSYELITSPAARGAYYADDLRSILPAGVDNVMATFADMFLHRAPVSESADARPAEAPPAPAAPEGWARDRAQLAAIICDEDLLDASATVP